jgi:cold-inducible RNA-binding protein
MSMKLYVGNFSFGTTEDDLQQLFSQVGSVESISMVTDRDTGRSRGFAFVEMSSKSEGEAAIAKFNGSELDGRSLTVNEAKPRESHGGGFGGGRNGGRSGGFGRGRGSGSSRY